MTEKQVIEKLNMLSDIKPSKEWADLAKQNILSNNFDPAIINNGFNLKEKFSDLLGIINSLKLQTKLAYSFALLIMFVGGLVGVSQNAVPGDLLFAVRSTTDRVKIAFVGQEDYSKLNFEVANKRLDELVAIVKDNNVNKEDKNIALIELKASIKHTAKNLIASVKENPKAVNDIVAEAKKIKESAVLLDIIGDSEKTTISNDLYKEIVESEVISLESITLTESQQETLKEIKDLVKDGKYSDAFEKILTINN